MISKHEYYIGQKVQFQDHHFCWKEGEIVDIKWRDMKIVGPSGRLEETKPSRVTIAFRDTTTRRWREQELPMKRVRATR